MHNLKILFYTYLKEEREMSRTISKLQVPQIGISLIEVLKGIQVGKPVDEKKEDNQKKALVEQDQAIQRLKARLTASEERYDQKCREQALHVESVELELAKQRSDVDGINQRVDSLEDKVAMQADELSEKASKIKELEKRMSALLSYTAELEADKKSEAREAEQKIEDLMDRLEFAEERVASRDVEIVALKARLQHPQTKYPDVVKRAREIRLVDKRLSWNSALSQASRELRV